MVCRSVLKLGAVTLLFLSAGALAYAQSPKMKMTTETPPYLVTPNTVETRIGTLKFTDGFPDEATAAKVYDNLDFQRGVQAYLTALPAVSIEAFLKGFTEFGSVNQTVLISEQLLDAKSLFLTANTTTPYTLLYLSTKDGPLVVEVPPEVLGPIDDAWFRWVTDVGITGPDKGKRGRQVPVAAARLHGRGSRGVFRCASAHDWKPAILPHLLEGRRSQARRR
jgi:hypothetical protein